MPVMGSWGRWPMTLEAGKARDMRPRDSGLCGNVGLSVTGVRAVLGLQSLWELSLGVHVGGHLGGVVKDHLALKYNTGRPHKGCPSSNPGI